MENKCPHVMQAWRCFISSSKITRIIVLYYFFLQEMCTLICITMLYLKIIGNETHEKSGCLSSWMWIQQISLFACMQLFTVSLLYSLNGNCTSIPSFQMDFWYSKRKDSPRKQKNFWNIHFRLGALLGSHIRIWININIRTSYQDTNQDQDLKLGAVPGSISAPQISHSDQYHKLVLD